MTFQEIILTLQKYWADQHCIIAQPYDVEKGAGTMSPYTFLKALGPEPWRVAYVEPSRRPADARYGENPNRLYQHHQFQVILKPSPDNVQDLYLGSLKALGIDPVKHDIRFVEDNWEAPTLGAWGLGWEVWLDGMEITQYTYFQQVGSIDCQLESAELTYGLERIAMYIQNINNVFDSFEEADAKLLFTLFDEYEGEAKRLLEKGIILPAYDYVLKCSHAFNILDARKAISVTERTGFIGRVRNLARLVAQGYLKQREEMGYPLLKKAVFGGEENE